MTDNEIRVVITGVASDLRRALDGAKGDLSGLSAKIKEVPGQIKIDVRAETLAALGRLRELKDAAKDVPTDIRIHADADTGIATAKLRLLERQARETEESIARAQLGGLLSGGGGGFGRTLTSGLTSGGLPGAGPLAIGAAAAPLAAGAVGSAIPLIGSAGAGLLGLGALATSVLGIGGAGLGSMLGVLVQAKTNISNVTTAMTALEKAQSNYGASSKQAQHAQANLNSVMAEAGPQASKIAQQLGALRDQWTKVSAPATQALDQIIIPGLKVVHDLMPVVAGIAKQAFDAIGKALDPIFKGLSSPAFKKVLTDLGDAFARLAGPAIGAFSNLMRAFFSVAVAAAPYVIQIAQAFERWTKSFAESLSPGQRLNTLIGSLVSQAHSWWELIVAVGRLLVTVFSAGATQGKGLVDHLTTLLNKWNAWLHTEAGQAAMHKFFAQSLDLLRSVAGVLGAVVLLIANLAVGLIPAMTLLLKPLAELLATVSHWINDLSQGLPPVIRALPGLAVAVGVLASWQALKALVSATTGAMVGKLGLGGGAGKAAAPAEGAVVAGGGASALMKGLGIAGIGSLIAVTIGQSIHGAVGKAVSDIGSGAAIGGGLGSVFGPWGIAAGAALGAGLGAAIDLFTSHGKSDGQKWADNFLAPLPAAVRKHFEQPLSQPPPARTLPPPRGGGMPQADAQRIQASDAAKQSAYYFNRGYTAAQATVAGLRSVKVPTTVEFLADFQRQLRRLPAQSRPEGAKLMLSYAQGLQESGKLPKGAVNIMIESLQQMFPSLKGAFRQLGIDSSTSLATAMKFDAAKTNLAQTLADVKGKYGIWTEDTKITGKNIWQNMGDAMKQLHYVVNTTTGKTRDDAIASLKQLHDKGVALFRDLSAQVAASASDMKNAVATGSQQAYTVGAHNWGLFADSINKAMASGVVSTSEGMKLITQALNDTLKALGEKPISITQVKALGPANVQALASGQTTVGAVTLGLAGSGGHAGGGYIGQPGQQGADNIPIVVGEGEAILNRHQQAPVEAALRHTYGMGLGDLFSQVTRPHYMARGGFAGGGTISYSGLEGLWDQAGGNPGAAALMAAIAEAESGGNPNARNPSGASGLWQILGLPFPGNPFDPLTNARMAVAKYRAGGTSPWDASKAVWGKFLHGGVPPSSGAFGQTPTIPVPKVTGSGTVPNIVRAILGKSAGAANALLASLAPAGGGAGGGGGTPGAQGPKGLGTFDGLQVADWIIPVLNWARSHGWGGHITSGFRPEAGSEHALTQWPGGAVDVGFNTAIAQGTALENVLKRYPGHPNLLWGGQYISGYTDPRGVTAPGGHDYGHFSGTGHARGGFAGGQRFGPGGFAAPKLKGSSPAGMRNLSRIARHVTAQMLRATDLQNQYAGLSGSFPITEAAPQFLNPDGSLNAAGTAQHIADDNLLIGLDRKLLGIYEPLEGELEGELGHLLGSITGNQKNIGRDEKLIAANKQRIAALRTASLKLSAPMAPSKTLAGAQAQLRSLRAAFAKRIAAVPRGRQATAERAALHAQEAQQAGAVQSVIADERARIANRRFSVASEKHRIALQIAALTGRDTKLAQDVTGMRSVLTGAGGGSSENQALSTIENAASSFGTVLWGSGGRFAGIDQKNQGVIFTTRLDLQALGQDIAKTTATAQSGPDLSALNALLTQQLQSSRTALAVSESQFGVLSGFEPLLGGRLVGSFQSGIDFVPRTGLALVHKGETITPDPYGPQGNRAAATVHTAQGETVIELHFDGDSGQLVKLVDARIGQKALRVVSDHAGQRARLLSGVRRP